MPNRITRLTPEQTARIPEWVEKWVAIGLSTEPVDFDRATAAALACYDTAGLRRPRLVVRMGSPLAAVVGGVLGAVMFDGKRDLYHVKSEGWIRIRSEVWRGGWRETARKIENRVSDQIRSLLTTEIWRYGRDEIESQIMSQIVREVDSPAATQIVSQVGSEVWGQIWNQVMLQVGGKVKRQVRSRVEIEAVSTIRNSVKRLAESRNHQYHCGLLWAGFYAEISFLRDVCGWENFSLARLAYEEALALNCGWTWWHHDVVAISDRPRLLRRDQSGRLHSESGPALQYPDGWSLYCWHGYLLPPSHQWLIAERHKLTAEAIDAEPNAELRRIALEIYGFDRYLAERNASVIAEDEWHGQRRRLLSCDVGGDTARILELANGTVEPDGTRRKFHLGAMLGETPHDCVAASFGRPADKYREAIGT